MCPACSRKKDQAESLALPADPRLRAKDEEKDQNEDEKHKTIWADKADLGADYYEVVYDDEECYDVEV